MKKRRSAEPLVGLLRQAAVEIGKGTAFAGSAAVLLPGDQKLLAFGLFRGLAILSPRDFYERLRG